MIKLYKRIKPLMGTFVEISIFYQDPEAHYPAWFREGYPEVPEAGAGFNKWLKKELMPINAEGKVTGSIRGAFGWYAAFVIPDAYGQWTHGTIGWGEDKDKYIKKTKNLITNIVSNPRSSGCTRTFTVEHIIKYKH